MKTKEVKIVYMYPGCGARSTFLSAHMNPFWQLSGDDDSHGWACHATTASPTSSFRAPWRVVVAEVGRRNAGRTRSKSGCPCPCRYCSWWPPAETNGRGSLLSRSSCPPDIPIGHVTDLTWPGLSQKKRKKVSNYYFPTFYYQFVGNTQITLSDQRY